MKAQNRSISGEATPVALRNRRQRVVGFRRGGSSGNSLICFASASPQNLRLCAEVGELSFFGLCRRGQYFCCSRRVWTC